MDSGSAGLGIPSTKSDVRCPRYGNEPPVSSIEHRLRLLSYSRFSATFWQDFRRAIGRVAHPIIDRHRLRIHDENSQAQPRERGAAPGKKDKKYGSRPAAAGRGEWVAANTALPRAPSPGRAFCKHHRLSRRYLATPGCAWLLSLKLEGLAGDPALRHRAGVHHHAPLVPAPPGWELRARNPKSDVRCPRYGNEPPVSSLDYAYDYDYDHDYELRARREGMNESPAAGHSVDSRSMSCLISAAIRFFCSSPSSSRAAFICEVRMRR